MLWSERLETRCNRVWISSKEILKLKARVATCQKTPFRMSFRGMKHSYEKHTMRKTPFWFGFSSKETPIARGWSTCRTATPSCLRFPRRRKGYERRRFTGGYKTLSYLYFHQRKIRSEGREICHAVRRHLAWISVKGNLCGRMNHSHSIKRFYGLRAWWMEPE